MQLISQGRYIIRILQHFTTKVWNITDFVILFHAIMEFCLDLLRSKFWLIWDWSICYTCLHHIFDKSSSSSSQSQSQDVVEWASLGVQFAVSVKRCGTFMIVNYMEMFTFLELKLSNSIHLHSENMSSNALWKNNHMHF